MLEELGRLLDALRQLLLALADALKDVFLSS